MTGTILWICNRDGNGIIVSENREYYFDTSSCPDFDILSRKDPVVFDINESVKDCYCAKNVIFNVESL